MMTTYIYGSQLRGDVPSVEVHCVWSHKGALFTWCFLIYMFCHFTVSKIHIRDQCWTAIYLLERCSQSLPFYQFTFSVLEQICVFVTWRPEVTSRFC